MRRGHREEDIERIFAKFEQVNTTDARQQARAGACHQQPHRAHDGRSHPREQPPGAWQHVLFRDPPDDSRCCRQVVVRRRRAGRFHREARLVAEDNELNMEIIAYVLDDMGFTVDKTTNGQEAVDAFEQSPLGATTSS